MKTVSGLLALFLLTTTPVGMVLAAEPAPTPADSTSASAAPATTAGKEGTPVTRLDAATDSLMKDMDENQLRQFGSIQNAYGIIRAVEDVQQSIARAVDSCGQAHAEIKSPMVTRFETWKDAIRPVMKDARTRLDKMILLQGFAQPSEVRSYLKKFEAAVVYRNQGITPVAITEKSDCEALLKSMEATQGDLTAKLTEALSLDKDIIVK